jgi:pimeloyl-ACP methyl ester carboxylesterase
MAAAFMLEELQIRIHGAASLPTLIYLPGLHGDWTLVGDFRQHVAGQVRFVEFIYPRTLNWSLDDYAAAVEKALAQHGITGGWLLGESYGSQIAWNLIARRKFSAQGLVLAGGFVKHPWPQGVRLMRAILDRIPARVFVWLLFCFAKSAKFRYRHSPKTLANIGEFISRRTQLDCQAMQHRLGQIAEFDPRATARATALPIFYLSGWLDPIVPWLPVRRWLRKNCPGLRGDKIIFTADHNVLTTAPARTARQILSWLRRKEFPVAAG